jgi:hypothetical protein
MALEPDQHQDQGIAARHVRESSAAFLIEGTDMVRSRVVLCCNAICIALERESRRTLVPTLIGPDDGRRYGCGIIPSCLRIVPWSDLSPCRIPLVGRH